MCNLSLTQFWYSLIPCGMYHIFGKRWVSDPDMHFGTFGVGGRENIPGIPGACATRNFTYLVRGPLNARCWLKHSWFARSMPSHHSMEYSVRKVKRNWHATANISGYRLQRFSAFTSDTMTFDWWLRHNTINFDTGSVMDGYWYKWTPPGQRVCIRKTVIKQSGLSAIVFDIHLCKHLLHRMSILPK